jgi:phosphomannomutase
MALILEYLAESRKPISELSEELPEFHMVKKKIKVKGNLNPKLKKLEREFKGSRINRVDGLRLDFEDFWLHIRKSNTEPVVRIIAEAKSKGVANKLTNKAINILK